MSDFIRDDDGASNVSSNAHLHQLIFRRVVRWAVGASDPDTFMGARAGSFLFAPDAPLEQAYQAQLEKAVRWTAQPEERA